MLGLCKLHGTVTAFDPETSPNMNSPEPLPWSLSNQYACFLDYPGGPRERTGTLLKHDFTGQEDAIEALTTETGKPFTFGKPAQALASAFPPLQLC